MPENLDQTDQCLLDRLQQGLPIDAQPFARLGEDIGIPESEVLQRVEGYFSGNLARRIGAVFDSGWLGYNSVLCAVDVDEADIDEVAGRISERVSVTHSYQRAGTPNLWFTVTALRERLDKELDIIRSGLGQRELLVLPAIKRFKVAVIFTSTPSSQPAPKPCTGEPVAKTKAERALVMALQGNLPLIPRPFDQAAGQAGMEIQEALALLQKWHELGALRRIAVILRHRNVGFVENGMCVWDMPTEKIDAAGKILAAQPEVTHCYERKRYDAFPYNMYAMVHSRQPGGLEAIRLRISAAAKLEGGTVLLSKREFKKASPRFFEEDL